MYIIYIKKNKQEVMKTKEYQYFKNEMDKAPGYWIELSEDKQYIILYYEDLEAEYRFILYNCGSLDHEIIPKYGWVENRNYPSFMREVVEKDWFGLRKIKTIKHNLQLNKMWKDLEIHYKEQVILFKKEKEDRKRKKYINKLKDMNKYLSKEEINEILK